MRTERYKQVMRVFPLISSLFAMILLAGCAPKDESDPTVRGGATPAEEGPIASEAEVSAFVQSVGDILLAQDWDGLHSKTSPELSASISAEELSQEYAVAKDQISTDFTPVRYEVHTGNLPLDAKEAEDVYGIKQSLSPSSWRTWTIISLHDGDSADGPAVDVRFLVVQKGADLSIAHIEFARGY